MNKISLIMVPILASLLFLSCVRTTVMPEGGNKVQNMSTFPRPFANIVNVVITYHDTTDIEIYLLGKEGGDERVIQKSLIPVPDTTSAIVSSIFEEVISIDLTEERSGAYQLVLVEKEEPAFTEEIIKE